MKNHARARTAIGGLASAVRTSLCRVIVSGLLVGCSANNQGDEAVRVVYAAQRGVSTPWFVPVDANGVGAPVQLGPRRGAGYGFGEGEVSYPQFTPDGKYVVVVFYPMDTPAAKYAGSKPALFALRRDGSDKKTPIKIAVAPGLSALERVYSETAVAYVANNALYVARLDGSDVAAPILVAKAPASLTLRSPHWLPDGQRLIYSVRPIVNGVARVFRVAADGSQVAKPTQVMAGEPGSAAGSASWVAAILPDGRLIVRGEDKRLYRVGGGTKNVVLTPKGTLVSPLGVSKDGGRLAAVLRTSWQAERRVVSVATDGSEAVAPVELTPTPAKKVAAILSRDAAAVAWSAVGSGGKWAVWQAPLDAKTAPRRVTPWSTLRLRVTDYDHAAGVLVGVRADGAVLRYLIGDNTAQQPLPPQVLAQVDGVVNGSLPWPTLSADAKRVLYDANLTTGWKAWTQSLGGGQPTPIDPAWYRRSVTKWGVLQRESVQETAAFITSLAGVRQQLTAWRNEPLIGATITPDGAHLLFARRGTKAGWYAVPIAVAASDGAASEKMAAETLVMPSTDALLKLWQTGSSLGSPMLFRNHLLRRNNGRLEAFFVDGRHAEKPLDLGEIGPQEWVVDAKTGVVAFVSPQQKPTNTARVVSVRLMKPTDTVAPAIAVMTIAGVVTHLRYLPNSGRVVAAVRSPLGTTSLWSAAADGSEATTPRQLAAKLPGLLLDVIPTPTGGHMLTTHSILPTAVPRPGLTLATPLRSLPADPTTAAKPVAPKGFDLWRVPWRGCGASDCGHIASPGLRDAASQPVVHTSVDGSLLVVTDGKKLYSVRLDGSDASAAPPPLGDVPNTSTPADLQRGDRLLLTSKTAVFTGEMGAKASGLRQLTAPNTIAIAAVRWMHSTVDGVEQVAFLRGATTGQGNDHRLYSVPSSANLATATALTPANFGVRKLVASVPARIEKSAAVLVESTDGDDHSLYLVLSEEAGKPGVPLAITPIDDAGERLIGFVRTAPP